MSYICAKYYRILSIEIFKSDCIHPITRLFSLGVKYLEFSLETMIFLYLLTTCFFPSVLTTVATQTPPENSIYDDIGMMLSYELLIYLLMKQIPHLLFNFYCHNRIYFPSLYGITGATCTF